MEEHIKKYLMIIYFVGLLAGVVIMNYMIKEHGDITLALIEKFQGLDKLEYVQEKEIFLYLLCKRVKQLAICYYLYTYLAKKFILYVMDFYFSFVIGVVMALFVYYGGLIGIVRGTILFLPIAIFYGCIYYMAWMQLLQHTYAGKNTDKKKVLVFLFLVMGVTSETAVNYFFM